MTYSFPGAKSAVIPRKAANLPKCFVISERQIAGWIAEGAEPDDPRLCSVGICGFSTGPELWVELTWNSFAD
jgi:hypothetical protein